jgi:hypothetical protein
MQEEKPGSWFYCLSGNLRGEKPERAKGFKQNLITFVKVLLYLRSKASKREFLVC